MNSLLQSSLSYNPYLQPERLQAKEYTIRSDVWSSGITLLELVENRYPFPPDLTVVELMTQIMKHAVSISSLWTAG